MTKKQEKDIVYLLFEIYQEGVEQSTVDLTSYANKIDEILNFERKEEKRKEITLSKVDPKKVKFLNEGVDHKIN